MGCFIFFGTSVDDTKKAYEIKILIFLRKTHSNFPKEFQLNLSEVQRKNRDSCY